MIEKDKDDNKFIDAYVAGQAEYIITNDKHFQMLEKIDFPKVNCMKLVDFVNIDIV